MMLDDETERQPHPHLAALKGGFSHAKGRAHAQRHKLEEAADRVRQRVQHGRHGDHEHVLGGGGLMYRGMERVPVLNAAAQYRHKACGDAEALERARLRNPMGPNGYVTKAAEFVPVANTVVQEVHRAKRDHEALARAKRRNPLGTDGVITQVGEHIPLVSDAIRQVHKLRGKTDAAERSKMYTVEELFSKDGTMTRVAELLPGSNIVVAAMQEMSGNREEAKRALNFLGNWKESGHRDGAFTKVAELLPGTDVVAFAAHMACGYYAQALRCLTKTSYLHVNVDSVVFLLRASSVQQTRLLDLQVNGVETRPKQASLLAGLMDMGTHLFQVDRHGDKRRRRKRRFFIVSSRDLDSLMETTPRHGLGAGASPTGHFRSYLRESVVTAVNDQLDAAMQAVWEGLPDTLDWVAEFNTELFQGYRDSSMAFWLALPDVMPPPSPALAGVIQKSTADIRFSFAPMAPPERVRPSRKRTDSVAPEGCAAVACFACMGCIGGLGLKFCGLACLAGMAAGVAQVARSGKRHITQWFNSWNEQSWAAATAAAPLGTPSTDLKARAYEEELGTSASDLSEEKASFVPGASAFGVLAEVKEEDMHPLAALVQEYLVEDFYADPIRRLLMRFLDRYGKPLLRAVVTPGRTSVPFVIDAWIAEIPIEGLPFKLVLPEWHLAILLDFDLIGSGPLVSRLRAFVPECHTENLLKAATLQLEAADLRELDERLQGFTEPIRVLLHAETSEEQQGVVRLELKGLHATLHLPT